MTPVELPDMTYSLVIEDHTGARAIWLVALVHVNGPATVVGRFDAKADADADALRWTTLEGSAS